MNQSLEPLSGPIPVRFRCGAKPFRRSRLGQWLAFTIAVPLAWLRSARAESHGDYKFEDYREDAGRTHVQTQSALLEADITRWLKFKGQVVFDAISGATPTGAPAPSQIPDPTPDVLPSFNAYPNGATGRYSDQVPLAKYHDYRRGGSVETGFHLGAHTITPQYSYSGEHDYISHGAALNYAWEFNQKNTTLNLGVSHNWDHIIPADSYGLRSLGDAGLVAKKRSWDFLIGVNQLLTPKTVLTVNLTLGTSAGYLDDPYRGVTWEQQYQASPTEDGIALSTPEHRPGHRVRQVGLIGVTQFFDNLNGSLETSYRISHDSYGVLAHTLSAAWFQKVGPALILSPSFRYYRQNAADFYYIAVPGDIGPGYAFYVDSNGDPVFADTRPGFTGGPHPKYYSSDWRLSDMESFTYGFSATINLKDRVHLDFAYKRYIMQGTGAGSVESAYPSANVFTVGARVWF